MTCKPTDVRPSPDKSSSQVVSFPRSIVSAFQSSAMSKSRLPAAIVPVASFAGGDPQAVSRILTGLDDIKDGVKGKYFGVSRQTIQAWKHKDVQAIDRNRLERLLDPEMPMKLRAFAGQWKAERGAAQADDDEGEAADAAEPSDAPSPIGDNRPPFDELLGRFRISPARHEAFQQHRREQKAHSHEGQLAARFKDFQRAAADIIRQPNNIDEVGWMLFHESLPEDRCYLAVSTAVSARGGPAAAELAALLLVERQRYLARPYVDATFRDRDNLGIFAVFLPLAAGNVVYLASSTPKLESEIKTTLVGRRHELAEIVNRYLDEIG